MTDELIYDTAVIGGGLAGLGAAIRLAKKGRKIILFEKDSYPLHKVCGEYISLESWRYLTEDLDLPLDQMNLPVMKNLRVTSGTGAVFSTELPLGGFGISRFLLDNKLKEIAEKLGVVVLQTCKVSAADFDGKEYTVATNKGSFKSLTCISAFGKRSNLDVSMHRKFIREKSGRLNNYIGVKYHIKCGLPADEISLHIFKNGYCGISKIEDDKYCLCYLTKASNLKDCGNSIEKMEADILSKNPALKKILIECVRVSGPVTISQVSFSRKTLTENHILMTGDSAGMITPLCGNGMSIALHTSKIAANVTDEYLRGKISREKMEINYAKAWTDNFRTRLYVGRKVQFFFGNKILSNMLISTMKINKSIARRLIKSTHGKSF